MIRALWFIAKPPPFGPIEGQKWFEPDFQPMRVPEEPVRIHLFSEKSSFYLPAFEISRSCRNRQCRGLFPVANTTREKKSSSSYLWFTVVFSGLQGILYVPRIYRHSFNLLPMHKRVT